MIENVANVLEVQVVDEETKQRERDLVVQVIRQALEKRIKLPPPPTERTTIHYTELPEGDAASPIATEWAFYRRQVGRLLSEGHENKWVLIKGDEIIGIWDTEEECDRVRLQRFLMQPVLLQQIRRQEPVLRCGGCQRRWQE